jgi:hypothetical protein
MGSTVVAVIVPTSGNKNLKRQFAWLNRSSCFSIMQRGKLRPEQPRKGHIMDRQRAAAFSEAALRRPAQASKPFSVTRSAFASTQKADGVFCFPASRSGTILLITAQ